MTADFGLWFSVPDTFTALDLGSDAEQRVGQMLARTTTLTDEQRLHVVVAQEVLIETMRHSDVGYAATSLVRVDGDVPRLSVAQFTVFVQPVRTGSDVLLDSVAARLDVPGLRREVGFLSLRAGRALAVVEDRRFSTGMTVLGLMRQREHTVRQVQLVLPFPDRRLVAVLALSTECLADWDAYVDVMGGIAGTVSFTPPGAKTSSGMITAALSGSAGRRL